MQVSANRYNQRGVIDTEALRRPRKVRTGVLLPADLKEDAQVYARDHDTTLTQLCIDGLRVMIGKDSR